MAINERVITGTTAAAGNGGGAASAEQGLILHLDANDVDSYDGDGSIWYDISTHDVTIPLSDNADDLELHLNASDSTSYDPDTDTTTWTDIVGSNDATMTSMGVANFDKDNGGYFSFDGGSDYATVSYDDSIYMTSNTGFTIEAWVNRDSNSEMYVIASADNSTYPYALSWNSTTHGWLGWISGSSYSSSSQVGLSENTTLGTGKWEHVVLTQSSSDRKNRLYVNGVLTSTSLAATGFQSTSSDVYIGAYHNLTGKFDGKIGAVRIYSKELSASEVGQNYRHGRDYIYTELNGNSDLFLHYDPADTNSYSGTGTTLTDLAGNNNADLLGGIESGWDEELGNSFPITGSGDGITTSSTVSINPSNGMTIEMWAKVKTDVQNYLFSFDGTDTSGFGLSYRSNTDKITWFYQNSGGSTSAVNSDTIVLNEWTHIVATTNGSSAQFYTNGVLSEETSDNAYSYSYNEDLHFGNLYDLAQNSNSDIGQIRFYKGGLTADEVMQNYLFTKNDYPNGFNGTNSGLSFNPSGYFTYDSTSDKSVITNGKQKGILPNSSTDTTTLIWARIHSTSPLSYILTGRSSSIRNFYFRHYLNNLTLAIYNDSQSRDINENFGSLSANTWYLLGFRTTTDGNVRVNVITTGTSTFTDATATMSSYESTDVDFNIGFYQTGNGFDGDIGAVKVYNKYLSDSEITAYFDATKDVYGL